jgi:tetratricopeptide (TPR) repeat protein
MKTLFKSTLSNRILCALAPWRLLFFIVFFSLSFTFCSAGGDPISPIDSLKNVLTTQKEDSSRVKTLNILADKLIKSEEYEDGELYTHQAMELAVQLGYKKGEVKANTNLANINFQNDRFPEALKFYTDALKISDEIGFRQGSAAAHNSMGVVYKELGMFAEALKHYYAALKINEEVGDLKYVAGSYNNIGVISENLGNLDEALKSFLSALEINVKTGNDNWRSINYNNIGNVYKAQHLPDKALESYFSSLNLKLEKVPDDKKGIARCYNNIGSTYEEMGKLEEGEKYQLLSLKLRQEGNDKVGIASSWVNMGSLYIKLKKFDVARKGLEDGLAIAKETGVKDIIRTAYKTLSQLDSAQGNYKSAYEHYQLYTLYRDSINTEDALKSSQDEKRRYEFSKKEELAKLEQEKQDAVAVVEAKSKNLFGWLMVSLAIALIASLAFFRLFLNKKKV